MTKEVKKTIRQNVERLMRDYPVTRDNDKTLIFGYWKLVDNIVDDSGKVHIKDMLNKSTPTESITRARRLIQEEGKYLPTSGVVAGRRGREKDMKDAVKQREVV